MGQAGQGNGFEYAPRNLDEQAMEFVYQELQAARHGEKTAKLNELAQLYQVSKDTIYRASRIVKRKKLPEVKTRSDAGLPRKIKTEWVRTVFELQQDSRNELKRGVMMAAEDAIRMAEVNGLIPTGCMSVSSYNRRARSQGYRIPEPRFRIEASHVNQRHLMDASGTSVFTAVEDLGDGDWLLQVRDFDLNANTRKWKGERAIWMAGIVDDRSRCAFVRYFATVGEDTLMMLRFLQQAWAYHPETPFGGLPEILQTDNGAFARNRIIQEFFDLPEISVKHTRTMPHHKEAQGKVERLWRTIKTKFERPFIAMHRESMRHGKPFEITLSGLNEYLENWLEEYNAKKHPTDITNRADIWRDHAARNELRLPPEDLASLPYAVEEKTLSIHADFNVKALRNNDERGWFHVPTRFAGRRVLIFRNALGQVLIRDPYDPEQEHVEASPGRRVVAPSWDEKDGEGGTLRVHDFGNAVGAGRQKTPAQKVAEDPHIDSPVMHPNAVRPSGPLSLSSRQKEGETVKTPFTTHRDEFHNIDAAKHWIAKQLGVMQLIAIKINYPGIWLEIEETLDKTLDRETIAARADAWAARLHQGGAAQGG
ncbi:DDE-type integrase/transposase/recombinase [bacterium]|nr:DDE-type integrase/transposase/recombinase [bacterium]